MYKLFLADQYGPLVLYFMVNNKQFVQNTLNITDEQIEIFKKNTSLFICQICYREKSVCIEINDMIVCHLCL